MPGASASLADGSSCRVGSSPSPDRSRRQSTAQAARVEAIVGRCSSALIRRTNLPWSVHGLINLPNQPTNMTTIRVLISVIALFTAAAVQAAPLVQYRSGATSVTLSSTLVTALSQLQVSVSALSDGKLSRRGVASFPITSATVDLGTASAEFLHSGGLVLKGGSTEVVLSNFLIDTTGETFELTGTVSANGAVVGRLPLFNIALADNSIIATRTSRLRVNSASLTLTAEAASALNGVFNVTAFTAGIPVGTALLDARSGTTKR